MRTLLSFLGAPGSGKGTQAELLAGDYRFFHIITGDLIRNFLPLAEKGNDFAKQVKHAYEKGIPQPDHIATQLVFNRLEEAPKDIRGVIFDPYPLSIGQAKVLDEYYFLHEREYHPPHVVYFHISEEEALTRLRLRAKKEHRIDDTDKLIRVRYREYTKRCQALKEYFDARAHFIQIDGSPSVDVIYQDLQSKLANLGLLPE